MDPTARLDAPEIDAGLAKNKEQIAALAPKATPRVTDPDLTGDIEINLATEAPGSGTKTDHRFTVLVPNPDNTEFGLGKAGAKDKGRIADVGITGRTDSHIHWHVKTNTPTVVSLGEPATSVLSPIARDAKVPLDAKGYGMVTEGMAWQESALQHTLVSRDSNITIHAQTGALLQVDAGPIDVFGKQPVAIASGTQISIAANSDITPRVIKNRTAFDDAVGATTHATVAQDVLTGVDFITDAISWALDVNPSNNVAKADAADWGPPKPTSKVKVGLDALNSLLSLSVGFWSDHAKQNAVGLSGRFVGASANIAAQIYGHQSACLASALNAGVLGGYAATVKAACVGTFAELEVVTTCLLDVKTESMYGEASLRGKKGVQITSSGGPAVVQSSESARLGSISKGAYVYGLQGAAVLSGDTAGFGVHVTDSSVTIGKLTTSPKAISPPQFEVSNVLEIRDKAFRIEAGESFIEVGTQGIILRGKNIEGQLLNSDGTINMDCSGSIHMG